MLLQPAEVVQIAGGNRVCVDARNAQTVLDQTARQTHGSGRCGVVDGNFRIPQKRLCVPQRLLRARFVFCRVIGYVERRAEGLKISADDLRRVAQGQIQECSAEAVCKRLPARFCRGIVGDVKRGRRHVLIVFIGSALRDIAQRALRQTNDFDKLGGFIGFKAVSEDVDACVLRARL